MTYEKGYADGKEAIFYVINVDVGSESNFTLSKRFSAFVELREKLSKLHDKLPELPGKTLFKVTKVADIETRRLNLQKFLQVVFCHSRPLLKEETFTQIKICLNS